MGRFVVLLLFVVVGALVIALFFDHRDRRDARIDRLRHAFLHGAPLAGTSRPTSLVEVVHPGGVCFRVPASWAIEIVGGDQVPGSAPTGPAAGRRLQVEVVHLDGPVPGSPSEALMSLVVEGERAIHVLENGHALMKSVDTVRGPDGLVASYTWRLGRVSDGGGLSVAVFRLSVAVESAAGVIAQSDLGTLDREVRAATFPGGTAASSA